MADDPDVTVTDADMEDPELLAELAALTGGGDPPKPTPKPDLAAQRADLEARIMAKKKEAIRLKADKPACAAAMREYKAMEAQLNKLNASAAPPALPPPAPPPTRKPPAEPTDKDIAAVTVTDEDMDDPELLAELTALSGPSSAAECSGGGGGGSRRLLPSATVLSAVAPPPPSMASVKLLATSCSTLTMILRCWGTIMYAAGGTSCSRSSSSRSSRMKSLP